MQVSCLKKNSNIILYCLYIGNIVLINIKNGKNFAIILYHQKNDIRLAFIIVDWFEEVNQKILGYLVYKLIRSLKNNCRRVFFINLVNAINIVHFVYSCRNEECDENNYNSRKQNATR